MKYKMLGTKVSPQTKERITELARRKGMSPYRILQMVADTIVRYMDDSHALTPEMEEAMSIFEHLEGWEEAFNICDYTARPQVTEATYYLADDSKGKGARAVHVERKGDKTTQTYNTQLIFERAVCLLMPGRYRRMRLLCIDMGCTSLLQLLDLMIDSHTSEEQFAELRNMFRDTRGEKGEERRPSPYVRHQRKTID